MKKLLLIALALIFCACDSSDDLNDKFIGIWKQYREVEVYDNGEEEEYLPSVCELKNRFTFNSDGTFFMTSYPVSDDPNCEELVGNLYQSGTWERLTEIKYELVFNCMIPDCDSYTEILEEVTFPTASLMRVKFFDDFIEDDVDYYYLEFLRVE